jgi:uncharacterized protein (DUF1778 family)
MATITEERERITMRVPKRMRQALEEAASLSGATVDQFMLQTAYQEAQRMLENESVIRLTREQAEKMWELVENPPKPNAHLKKAFADFKKNVVVS